MPSMPICRALLPLAAVVARDGASGGIGVLRVVRGLESRKLTGKSG